MKLRFHYAMGQAKNNFEKQKIKLFYVEPRSDLFLKFLLYDTIFNKQILKNFGEPIHLHAIP